MQHNINPSVVLMVVCCRIQRLSLAGNQLTGNLAMVNWTSSSQLHTLNLSSNLLTGSLDSSWAALRLPVVVDVSSNNLTGPLPQAWGTPGLDGAAMSLVLLDASHNALTGV